MSDAVLTRRSRPGLLGQHHLPALAPLWRAVDRVLPAWRPRPAEDTVRRLAALYAEENEKLFAWLGRRPAWTAP